jgi:hypothetical protein
MQMGKIQGPPPMMPPHSEQTFVVKRNQIWLFETTWLLNE